MKYRPEIDGLRALAVMPVILFHAGFSIFSGGFIGVDVFFVISGYLIAQGIIEEQARGSFSFKRFYARRARRILPPLFAVMLATIPFAYAWMLPSQYEDFSRSLIAVVLFVSNVFFWHESGYFAAEASEKPLLHTWSLGVEEQFYLIVPLLLIVLLRAGRRPAFYAIAIAAFLSFVLGEYASRYSPSANFFLIPMRAWELLVGCLCAFAHTQGNIRYHNLLSLLGLGMIGVAFAVYDEHMRLPSAYTLLPVSGVALIVLYGTMGSIAARALSWRPFVGIGLVSYSAYLWHHPLFALARVHILVTPPPLLMLALSAVALGLGALTWLVLERPFRIASHPLYVSNQHAIIAAVFGALLLLSIGIEGDVSHGRLVDWMRHASSSQTQAFRLLDNAHQETSFFDNGACIFNVNELTPVVEKRLVSCRQHYGKGVAVIGDSHAINLFFVLKEHSENHPFIAGISQGMCRPHTPKANCYYDALVTLLTRHPDLFHDVIYEQAGFHLLHDAYGKDIDRGNISGLALDMPVPDFLPNITYIDAVKAYLITLTRFARVTWFGPRIEPEMRDMAIIHSGCDYPFRLRPNQQHIFTRLDEAVRQQLASSAIRYRSQIDMVQFDMSHDFLSCDKTYFLDGDHYSADGEHYFAARITLDAILHERGLQ